MFKKSWQAGKLSLVLLVVTLLMARTWAQSDAPSSATTQPAQSSNSNGSELQQIDQYNKAPTAPLAQMTSVSQLSDVQLSGWAFQALQSLSERYGCIAGYSDDLQCQYPDLIEWLPDEKSIRLIC